MIDWALSIHVALWLGICLFFFTNEQASLFHPCVLYLVFHGIVFIARPLMIRICNFDVAWEYMQFHPSPDQFIKTLAISSWALICFFTSCFLAGHVKIDLSERIFEITPAIKSSFIPVVVIMLPIGLYSIYKSGTGAVGENIDGVYVLTESNGYINDFQQVLGTICLAILLLARFSWSSCIPLMFYFAYRAYMGWGRWTIILTLYAVILLHTWYHHRKWPSPKFLLILPVFYVVFAILGDNRDFVKDLIAGERTESVFLEKSDFKDKYDTLDFANFDYLAFVVAMVPDMTGTYTYGAQYLQLFTEPIPRALWKEKPYGEPIKFFNLNDYGNFVGLTVSLVGDGWMSGGWLGLTITMVLAGVILGRIHHRFWCNQNDMFKVLTYVVFYSVIVQLFRDGGITIFKFILFTLMPIFFWKFLLWVQYSNQSTRPRLSRWQAMPAR